MQVAATPSASSSEASETASRHEARPGPSPRVRAMSATPADATTKARASTASIARNRLTVSFDMSGRG